MKTHNAASTAALAATPVPTLAASSKEVATASSKSASLSASMVAGALMMRVNALLESVTESRLFQSPFCSKIEMMYCIFHVAFSAHTSAISAFFTPSFKITTDEYLRKQMSIRQKQ